MDKSRYEEMLDQFIRFNKDHPEVWGLFDKFTRQLIAGGHKRGSVRMVFERIRWETSTMYSEHEFKVNNNHAAFYARVWMAQNPEYTGFFRTRNQVSADLPATGLPPLTPQYFDFEVTEPWQTQ